jgi:uncharacterized protein YjbI with pentapeptide repeats
VLICAAQLLWIPAFAGMTKNFAGMTEKQLFANGNILETFRFAIWRSKNRMGSCVAVMIMIRLARTGFALMGERGLILSFVPFCILLLAWLPPCTTAQDMETGLPPPNQRETSQDEWRPERPTSRQRLEPFVRQGTLEAKTKVPADDVLNAIAAGRDIDIGYVIIDGDLDIGEIAGQLQRDESGKPVIWGDIGMRNCEIRGYTFSSATFRGSSIFSSTTFIGDTDFVGTDFNKYADFSDATFSGDVEFTDATFRRNAAFIRATFNGDADFRYATFSGDVPFRNATFSENVDFTDATINGATDFIDATFTKSVIFLRTSMEHPASFQGVRFRENTVFAGLWNNVFRRMVKNLPERTVTDFSQLDTNSIMDGSSNPYLKRYIDDEQWIKSWRESVWWRQHLFVLWEATSHCGRSIGLWACWSAFIAIAFAIIYSLMSDSITFNIDRLSGVKPSFRGYLYYSIVTLTTLGYGDIVPLTNRARVVVGTEVCLGYVMLGGLISIFANKLSRRS